LPESLRRFAYINAAPVDTGRDFHQHVDRLVRSLDHILGPKATPPARGPAPSPSDKPTLPQVSAGGLMAALRSPFPWAVASVLALPFAAAYGELTPPWPPRVEIVTAVIGAVAFMLSGHWLRAMRQAVVNRVIVGSAGAFVVAVCVYMLAASIYIYQVPTTKERWVKGYACSMEAALLYKDKCPYLGVDELRGAEYEAERLWSVQSIATIKVMLLAMWLVTFIALATLIVAVVLHYAPGRRVNEGEVVPVSH
jgi:hypothetical protein